MRWVLSWILYGLGDLCYRLDFGDLYQWSMRTASDFQGDGPGPWWTPEDDAE